MWVKNFHLNQKNCFSFFIGLGTSTSKEAKEYFQDMVRHRIKFKHEGNQDDHAITMVSDKSF